MECHGIPWDTEDCHSVYGFYAISMAFQWNSMASRWNAVEFHGIQNIAIVYMVTMLFLRYFHGISVELYGIQVECCGMPWNSMGYRRILTVEILAN